MGNKQFWNTVQPFLMAKGFLHNEDIVLHIGDKTVTDCNELAKEFNEYYINIVQNTTRKATIKFIVPIMINSLQKPLLKPNIILALDLLKNTFKKKTMTLISKLLVLDKLTK